MELLLAWVILVLLSNYVAIRLTFGKADDNFFIAIIASIFPVPFAGYILLMVVIAIIWLIEKYF